MSGGAPTPASYGFGPSGTNYSLAFSNGYVQPYSGFTPVYWAPLNSSGVTLPVSSGVFGPQSYGPAITPELLAASQANLVNLGYTGLSSITYSGLNSQALIGSLFNKWGDTLGSIAQENADTFKQAVSKSAKACSGFFSCLFG